MASSQTLTFVDPNGSSEEARRRENPDGSVGGWVAQSAHVHPTAIVEVDAIVEPGAIVPAGAIIGNGTVVIGTNPE